MKHKLLTLAMLALVPIMGMAAEDNELTTAAAKSLYKNTSKKHVTVHDPSIVYNETNKRYYIVGSHKAGAYSTDLQNWTSQNPTWNTNDESAFIKPAVKKITKGGVEIDFPQFNAKDWAARTDAGYTIGGNFWAPDVIWNPVMKKWCFYLSINGNAWHSSIVLMTGDSPLGPFTYQGLVTCSGFNNGTHTWKDTDVPLVLGDNLTTLPDRYTPSGSYGNRWPNDIDPCVFYDEEGKLWLTYGSWSGGIWMLELDENTGLRDYDVTYPVKGSGDGVTSDPYFGTKIAGGYYVSGEGSYIEHIGDYYYLFMSYGFFDAKGGYEMRVFRSKNPNGPYVDAMNRNAIFNGYTMNYGVNGDKRGMKILGAYKNWGNMEGGELSQGHNSVIAAPDGRSYLIYHSRLPSENKDFEGHQVRVHQLFINSQGWLVASPFEYNGEQITDQDIATKQPFTKEEIAGEYQMLVHKYNVDYVNQECQVPVTIHLNLDGTVSGALSGKWSITEGTGYMQIVAGGNIYNGVVYEETMDLRNTHAVSFTGCSNTGVNAWAYKLTPKYQLAWQLNNQKVPLTSGASVTKSIDFGSIYVAGVPDVKINWTTSAPNIISLYGKYNPTGLEKDSVVNIGLDITTPGWYWRQNYKMTARSEENSKTTADWLTGLMAHYGFDNADRLVNTMNGDEVAQLLSNGTTALPTLTDGDPLRNGNVVNLAFGANAKESYVSIPNPLKGQSLADGATLSFFVKRADRNLWDALFGMKNGNTSLFLTGNAYLGFNAGSTNWLDINSPSTAELDDITVGFWHLVTIVFERTASSTTGGVTIYIDGKKHTDKYNGKMGDKSITTKVGFDYNLLVDHLAACDVIMLGNGSFWGSPNASFDDVMVYNHPLKLSEVMGLNQMINRTTDYRLLNPSLGIETVGAPHDANRTADFFDLQGRRVQNPVRGIYMKNGKKFIVK